ncbi:MAG: hypothetical protein F4Z31_01510 [Gemmatimonadetes bacterium]|nr:hypothetical protein [Gemmatimonadota bacterium]
MSGVQITLHYEGYDGVESVCDVLIEHSRPPGTILVTVSQREEDNAGTSITNRAKVIATQVARTMPSASMPDVRFVEHYQARPSLRGPVYYEVTFTWSDRQASSPQWRCLGVDGYQQLRDELGIPTN